MSKKNFLKELSWLLIGAGFTVFVGGKWNILVAPWLALFFLMRFVRSQERLRTVWLGFVPYALAFGLAMYGVVPLPFVFFCLYIAGAAFCYYMLFVIDRWAWRKYHNGWSALVFPLLLTVWEWLNNFGPFGTWNALGYTQFESKSLIQLVSLTGMWGITFMLGLFASFGNALWEKGIQRDTIRTYALPLFIFISLSLVSGGMSLAFRNTGSPTVKVAAVTAPFPRGYSIEDLMMKYIFTGSARETSEPYKLVSRQMQNDLLVKSQQLAGGGARIIFWSEANGLVFEDEEAAFKDRLSALAREKQVYIFAPLLVIRYGHSTFINKIIAITPEGRIAFEYAKSMIPPGELSARGEGVLKYIDTPYGRISTVICYDADFPHLLVQAGRNKVDIMLIPAADWPEIDPIHTYMASFRGIENGFSVVRHTFNGRSLATDASGRVLSETDYFTSGDKMIYADVPIKGKQTVYSVLYDWFAWLACLGLVVLSLAHLKRLFSGSSNKG